MAHRMLRGLWITLWLVTACASSSTPAGSRSPTPTMPPPLVVNERNITPTPSPAATPTPPSAGSINEFPPDVNPLTGLRVSDPAVLKRRPLAIKISNYPPVVRPQSGVDLADLVFEHYAEGGVTRFTAIYLGQDAEPVGSVRSARLIDLEIPAMFKAILAYSGASAGVNARIRASDFVERALSPDFGVGAPIFWRIPREGVAVEHTLFTSTRRLWEEATRRGINTPQDLRGMRFSEQPPAGGQPVSTFIVPYRVEPVTWRYDPGSGRWLRWTAGQPHMDALTGRQLSAANVAVVYAHHQTTDILEDRLGNYSIEIQIWGSGPVRIFRDGRMYEGQWQRFRREDMLHFVDAQGQPIPLKPGNTWFELVPLDMRVQLP
ncbi:Putative lipoprotein YerB [Candidatus Thermoflexus japonica]|uniref:Lipoprotein YerB n=1 Tax=Candidatus Thermoflexus japonica TaxID=2035417 RepID=A0A2H5Y8K7_9CHLR|nr:Putative lipoprotein YerB [Candidatus Thermoflexus japonica]